MNINKQHFTTFSFEKYINGYIDGIGWDLPEFCRLDLTFRKWLHYFFMPNRLYFEEFYVNAVLVKKLLKNQLPNIIKMSN